jgi:hypothetical protein
MRYGAYGAGIPIFDIAGFSATVKAAKTAVNASFFVFIVIGLAHLV